MINAIIIDDSFSATESLTKLLKTYLPQIKLLGCAHNFNDGIDLINKQNPQLVFLDIEINDKTGFELLNSFPEIKFKVIFVTGYNHFAIEAFEHNALHYLIKPVLPEKLIEAVNRINDNKPNTSSNIALTSNYIGKKIAFNTVKETKLVNLKDIICIKGEGRYSHIFQIKDDGLLIAKNLKELEKQLTNVEFYRLSKSYIINLNHVKLIKHVDGGVIEMINGINIPIPRRKRDEFAIRISDFLK